MIGQPRTIETRIVDEELPCAIRLALHYRLTLVGVLCCSLLVAVFWGGNIGGVYPIVEVAIKGKPLQAWVAEKIARTEAKSAELRGEIAASAKGPAAGRHFGGGDGTRDRAPAEAAAGRRGRHRHRPLAETVDRSLPARRSLPDRRLDRGGADGRDGRQGLLSLRQQHAGRTRRANGRVRSAQAAVPPHAADGSWASSASSGPAP